MNAYVVLLVIIVALALINFLTLFWVGSLQRKVRTPQPAVASKPSVASPAVNHKVDDAMAEAAAAAKTQLDQAIQQAAKTLSTDLSATSQKVNHELQELAEKYIRTELEEYHKTVLQFKDTATTSLADIQQTMDEQRQSLTAGLTTELKAERERLLAQFDNRLADVVSAYLIEALGNNADLGAQSQSLFAALEQHKEELKKDIASGIPTA